MDSVRRYADKRQTELKEMTEKSDSKYTEEALEKAQDSIVNT